MAFLLLLFASRVHRGLMATGETGRNSPCTPTEGRGGQSGKTAYAVARAGDSCEESHKEGRYGGGCSLIGKRSETPRAMCAGHM